MTLWMRWAMMKVVRPAMSRFRAARMVASVSVSTEEVASSRMRMRGSLSRARAMVSRCF